MLCPECGKDMTKGSLVTHRQTQNIVAKGGFVPEVDEAERGYEPRNYSMTFPSKAGPRPCPVEGCSGRALTRTAMMMHFCNWHVRYTMVILG